MLRDLFPLVFPRIFSSFSFHLSLLQCKYWVHFCYSKHSFLFFGDFIISSEAGVQQGDPLGPFLFCLVLQVLINALVKATPNLSLHNWYMDDGSLVGKIDVFKAWNIIKEKGPELGLFVNIPKCELISASGSKAI